MFGRALNIPFNAIPVFQVYAAHRVGEMGRSKKVQVSARDKT